MEPGKRCSAGFSLKTSASSSGSMAAMAAASREPPEPLRQLGRGREGLLHRDLLVQDHADQQGERVAAQQRVRLGLVAGE